MLQRIKFKIVVYGILLILAIIVLVWWASISLAQGRDYERLADLEIIQAELTDYFSSFNTYQVPGCEANTLVNYCVGRAERNLQLDQIVDPLDDGVFQYVVLGLSDDDFSIYFSLEKGIGGLPSGSYSLTKNGIETLEN